MFYWSQAFEAVTTSLSSECDGNLIVTRAWVKSRAKTYPYRFGRSNPRSRLNVVDWILILEMFSFLVMTATLLSYNLCPVSLWCSSTAESVDLVVLSNVQDWTQLRKLRNLYNYENSQDHWRNLWVAKKAVAKKAWTTFTKIITFTKSAKFTTISHTVEELWASYSKGCKEGPSKVTKITTVMKFTIIRQPIHEIYEFIHTDKGFQRRFSKKVAKLRILRNLR